MLHANYILIKNIQKQKSKGTASTSSKRGPNSPFDPRLEITITNDKIIWNNRFQDTGHEAIKDGDFREIKSKSGNPFDCPRCIALRERNFQATEQRRGSQAEPGGQPVWKWN